LNVCGEFGDSLIDVQLHYTRLATVARTFNGELATVVRSLLREYDSDPTLNGNARQVVAEAFLG
jgi:hypothetical protein